MIKWIKIIWKWFCFLYELFLNERELDKDNVIPFPKEKLEVKDRHIDEFNMNYDPTTDTYWWQKGKTYKLSDNFSTYEFECPCDTPGCKTQIIKKELVDKLQTFRDRLGEPIRINSAYRCGAYQAKLQKRGYKTAKKSQHLEGAAVDIMPSRNNGDHNKRLRTFIAIAESLFKAIGYAQNWLHVDLRKDRNRKWYY
jgi:hypothetical protein